MEITEYKSLKVEVIDKIQKIFPTWDFYNDASNDNIQHGVSIEEVRKILQEIKSKLNVNITFKEDFHSDHNYDRCWNLIITKNPEIPTIHEVNWYHDDWNKNLVKFKSIQYMFLEISMLSRYACCFWNIHHDNGNSEFFSSCPEDTILNEILIEIMQILRNNDVIFLPPEITTIEFPDMKGRIFQGEIPTVHHCLFSQITGGREGAIIF